MLKVFIDMPHNFLEDSGKINNNNTLESPSVVKHERITSCFSNGEAEEHLANNVALANQTTNFSMIKMEPEWDHFETKYFPENYFTHKQSEAEPKLIVRVDKLKVNEKSKDSILNCSYEVPRITSDRFKDCPVNLMEVAVKMENVEATNEIGTRSKTVFEEQKILLEADIKEELKHNEASMSSDSLDQENHDHYKCLICDYETNRKDHLKNHVWRHSNPEEVCMFRCDHCDFQTIHKSSLNRHLVRHKNAEGFVTVKDDRCEVRSRRKYSSKRHFCDYCDYQTMYKSHLKRHLYRHGNSEQLQSFDEDSVKQRPTVYKSILEVEMFKCTQCDYQTVLRSNLKRHLTRHNKTEEVFKCHLCQYQTIHQGYLKCHLVRHKNSEQVEMLKCDECEYQTIHKSHLKRHRRRHFQGLGMLSCNQCDFQSIHKESLKRHYLLHKNVKEVGMLKCVQCDYQTLYKSSLKRHRLQHDHPENVEVFNCNQCDYQTIEQISLHRHFLQHKEPKIEELNDR